MCIAAEINRFDVYGPVTGINRKYDPEPSLSDSIITFPFSFQLLDIDVYRLAHEFLEETLDLVFHFSLNDFCMNKTVGIPRVLDGPIHISTISVRPMLLRALSFP